MGWIILLIIAWYLVGIWGFVYWWTTDNDLTSNELGLTLAVGISGPISWIGGWYIHGDKTIIFKKRKTKE